MQPNHHETGANSALALSLIEMPEYMGFFEIAKLLFSKSLVLSRSLCAYINSLRTSGSSTIGETVVEDEWVWFEGETVNLVDAATIEGIGASRVVTTGQRFARGIGINFAKITVSIALVIATEAAFQAWQKPKYIEAELEASVARLRAQYVLNMFNGVSNLRADFKNIHYLEKWASKHPGEEPKAELAKEPKAELAKEKR
ncbi:hypothetical protein PG999_004432 [Apiospora kogelbergensis]|uniref:Uncharacterized protein n=1 Tax=Apiospora kogelbergensis TaxID=1337665 RepID=A0AAW0QZ77_9PEZI